ncbi:MAG TPA: glutamine--fructose-6-phosphate transaminase (isomerizing) [Steroidobacteraceae bacterium]|jgi:glucosamine--fructose-6-phosphate aminotransferase (isomerizing)|nr:glutamine--fructose-6-phosphate transaminase (isomerizing) [Steroidobacteraceae bacterium]
MCGIVGVVAERSAVPILMEGLRRLEYRGYDSAGLAVLEHGKLARLRTVGKVKVLQDALDANPINGSIGIAHTRWATHGVPTTENAHPHISRGNVAVVHNGIIENHETLRTELEKLGYGFTSETDTEVIAHRIHHYLSSSPDLLTAVRKTVAELQGAYALAVACEADPDCIVMARQGCPAVVGLGIDENFVASDVAALLPVTRRFMFLEEGDIAEVRRGSVRILDAEGNPVARAVRESDLPADAVERGQYRHFMLKEIHEQPRAIAQTLEERVARGKLLDAAFGPGAAAIFKRVKSVHIAACGTSFHAGLVASYLIEEICRIPARVEIASEYRYRNPVITPDTLFVTISQSGETADTLAALRNAKREPYLSTLSICNVAESSMVRESNLVLLTRAGPEIGVASTKAFTTQLTALVMLTIALAKHGPAASAEGELVSQLVQLPGLVEKTLKLDAIIQALAEIFVEKHHALFLGRGPLQAIAMEGALKLKEISYIHAEGYPAAELKHGPLALVDEDMPVVAVAPSNDVLEKLKSNLHEVRARGGKLYVFADPRAGMQSENGITVIQMPVHATALQAPVLFAIPMQLLAYHVAVLKGTDVDQPRNLAKSLTVE